MPVSCGQFSYANISPTRILGVSGTVEAMSEYEKSVLQKYGISRFVHVPSVYGQSNFTFKKTESVCIESGESKDLSVVDKDFVIKKAPTASQVTLCTAAFGRGTDFFCKDNVVENNGGVHIIQTFLSEEESEEVRIQGRTARQGKAGSYEMILMEEDLEETFSLPIGQKENIKGDDLYRWLCDARNKTRALDFQTMEANLEDASKKDQATHAFFEALISNDTQKAYDLFKEIYLDIKAVPSASSIEIDVSFVVDITGSMGPYMDSLISTVGSLADGRGLIMNNLRKRFPKTKFNFRFGGMGFRDIDDGSRQFEEFVSQSTKCHFLQMTVEISSDGSRKGFKICQEGMTLPRILLGRSTALQSGATQAIGIQRSSLCYCLLMPRDTA